MSAVSASRGEGTFTTPILWQGDINEPKQSAFLSVISSGSGQIICECVDQDDRQLSVIVFDIPKTGTIGSYSDKAQYDRMFEHNYVGVKVKVRILSEDQLRIFAIGVTIREE